MPPKIIPISQHYWKPIHSETCWPAFIIIPDFQILMECSRKCHYFRLHRVLCMQDPRDHSKPHLSAVKIINILQAMTKDNRLLTGREFDNRRSNLDSLSSWSAFFEWGAFCTANDDYDKCFFQGVLYLIIFVEKKKSLKKIPFKAGLRTFLYQNLWSTYLQLRYKWTLLSDSLKNKSIE